MRTPRGTQTHRTPPAEATSAPLFLKSFAHADSGPGQPDAPARIAFTARKR